MLSFPRHLICAFMTCYILLCNEIIELALLFSPYKSFSILKGRDHILFIFVFCLLLYTPRLLNKCF